MNIWPNPMMSADEALKGLYLNDSSLQRWMEALEQLELGAHQAIETSARRPPPDAVPSAPTVWVPVADLGPLPEILRERVHGLVALQQRAAALLANSAADVERELAEPARPRTQVQPVYVDVTG